LNGNTGRLPLPSNTFNPVKLEFSPSVDASGRYWLYLFVMNGPGIFFSTDSGDTWSQMDQPLSGAPWGGKWPTLTISPKDPQIVFAVNGNPGHWRGDASAAPGSQWYQVDGPNAGGTGVHVDVRDWVFTADPNIMLEADDGGIYRLRGPFSNAPRWEPAVGNIRVTEFLSVAYDSVHDTVFGASWDNAVPHQTIPGDIRWGQFENLPRDGIQVECGEEGRHGAARR
jgi:hypothetical protein